MLAFLEAHGHWGYIYASLAVTVVMVGSKNQINIVRFCVRMSSCSSWFGRATLYGVESELLNKHFHQFGNGHDHQALFS